MIVYGENNKQYLDYAALDDSGAHIDVREVVAIGAVAGLYFERPKSLRLVWNYICDIGIKNTLIKIISRAAEKDRNKKYLLIGRGEIRSDNGNNQQVVFIAPKHPAYPSRVWLPSSLFLPCTREDFSSDYEVRSLAELADNPRKVLEKIAGWDSFSEEPPSVIDWQLIDQLLINSKIDKTYTLDESSLSTSSSVAVNKAPKKRTATLFGLGNYAKTIIIPSLPKEITVNRIHEVDPLQITDEPNIHWDTSAQLSKDDDNEIVFIAGYHHTHNDLACDALVRGKAAVVEKPLVVNRDQLEKLSVAFKEGAGSYFACFHKRYSVFNDLALADLDVKNPQDAVNYHCIVYEVPLPDKHWYRWKSSSTRIISNGCHWIDHFLYLNDYAEPINIDCSEAANGTVAVYMELSNGACFTMTLTDIGSEKIGVQDHIELRRGDVTVKVVNGTTYVAESRDRVLRKKTVNKISSYRNMYKAIGGAILSSGKGDSWEHTKISSETVLKVNSLIEARRK